MKIIYTSILLLLCASCSNTQTQITYPVDQSYIYCINGDTQGSGFQSGKWLYTAEHVLNHQGQRELLAIDAIREPLIVQGQPDKTSIAYNPITPELGDTVWINGCNEYGEPLEGTVSLITEDGAAYGASGDKLILIDVPELTKAPLGFSGGPAMTENGWFGIVTGFDKVTKVVIVVVPSSTRMG